jgi:hypothetical protein
MMSCTIAADIPAFFIGFKVEHFRRDVNGSRSVDKIWCAFSPLWTVSLRKLERGNDLIGNVPWVRLRGPQASGSGAGRRRNGLKIAVLAIFLLFKIDQIDPNLPG